MSRRGRLVALVALCTALARAEDAAPPAPSPPPSQDAPDANTLEARRHFKAGTKLYRDGNYGGALAEFEEAYRLKPGAGSLQNIALSHKGLFRYWEAASTLEQLLLKHAGELSEGERQAVGDALTELRGLVASIKLRVVPNTARVLLDGRQLTGQDFGAPIVLNVGEHTLNVDAPGYAPERRVLRIAGGQREVPVDVELRCVAGFVDVVSNDPAANIAIDGIPRARRAYRGPVEPESDHLLQVYREGVETFEQTFQVPLCQSLRIDAKLEGPDSVPSEPGADAGPLLRAPPQRVQKGFYGLLTLDLLGLARQPLAVDVSSAQSGGGIGALGLRAGYRLSNPVALDLMLDVGALEVVGAYDEGSTAARRDYSLRSIHFGPNLNLMTTGQRVRFITTIGAGVVHHRLAIESAGAAERAEVRGLDPYFLLELGVGINYKQFLGQISLVGLIDGSTALQNGFTDESNRHLTQDLGTTLPMVGIGVRGGFSQWRPAR